MTSMSSRVPFLLVVCFALSVHGQSAAAPASSASVPTLYQRPNNSDCVASASSSTNYFPLQFQIVGSSPAEEDRVNVREQRIVLQVARPRGHSLTLTLTAFRLLWRKTSQCSIWTHTRWLSVVQLLNVHWLALIAIASRLDLILVQVVTNLYVNETYVLYQCGTSRPSADLVPAGSKFFQIPLTSVTVLETIPYAYLVSSA